MTPEQITRVKETWSQIKPISEQAAELFYNKLFGKLMTMINTAVVNLDKQDEVVGAVEDLGKRHVGYGVKDSDYDTVGAALLWTLQTGPGDAFTDEVRAAWTETYVTLARVMIKCNRPELNI
jgi:hemoglobin-like flavoprotein